MSDSSRINGEGPISPVAKAGDFDYAGLTKREYFAARALQGMLSADDNWAMTYGSPKQDRKRAKEFFDRLAILAVDAADSLLEGLGE